MKFKTVITIYLVLAFIATISYTATNPCKGLNHKKRYKKLHLKTNDVETCYSSILENIDIEGKKDKAIEVLSNFMYVNNSEYRNGAILELGNSQSPKAIPLLLKKGKHAIRTNNAEVVELVTSSLIALKGYKAARELAVYAKQKRKHYLLRVVRDEYLVYTSGKDFKAMEAIAGKIVE